MFYGIHLKKKTQTKTKTAHTQEKYPCSVEISAFAIITFLFFKYVILRQIASLQQSFYNEQHIATFLVDVANQTPGGIPASVACYNTLFQGCYQNFYLLRPVI